MPIFRTKFTYFLVFKNEKLHEKAIKSDQNALKLNINHQHCQCSPNKIFFNEKVFDCLVKNCQKTVKNAKN